MIFLNIIDIVHPLVVRRAVRSIPHGGTIEHVSDSSPQLVYQMTTNMLLCLWNYAYRKDGLCNGGRRFPLLLRDN